MGSVAKRTSSGAPVRKVAATRRKAVASVRPVEHLEPRAVEAARLLKLLANEQRLTVLCRLSGSELSVTELGEHVNLSQSALSQHLAKLRADGLVATRRDAQTIYYRLADPIAERLIGVLCEVYGGPSHD
ncbi:MAG: metalloregulator ArsR/SmtB family transcription factor [Hyphomonadaceae bacterium]